MRALAVIAAVPFLGTAGCGPQGGTDQDRAQANGPVTAAPHVGNETDYAGAVDRRNWRTANIAHCARAGQERAARGVGSNPAGIDFQPYCTCLVDRLIANVETAQLESLQFGTREQAVAAQCAREHALRPDSRTIEDIGGPFPDRS